MNTHEQKQVSKVFSRIYMANMCDIYKMVMNKIIQSVTFSKKFLITFFCCIERSKPATSHNL